MNQSTRTNPRAFSLQQDVAAVSEIGHVRKGTIRGVRGDDPGVAGACIVQELVDLVAADIGKDPAEGFGAEEPG